MRIPLTIGAVIIAGIVGFFGGESVPKGANFNHVQVSSIQIGDSCVRNHLLCIGDSGMLICINPLDSGWARGATGATGNTGLTGNNGTNGNTGVTGTNGNNGPTGTMGPTGSTGINGATGSQGVTGAQGITGATGSQGIQGATGITGTAGATGSAGTNGTNGSVGATGSAGTNGTNGVMGATGSNGTTGVTGATGIGAIYYTRTSGTAPTTYTAINYTSKFTTNGSGVIVDTLTTNGAFAGTAIFAHIYGVQLSGKYGGSFVSIPMSGYTVAANLKSITVNVGSGTILGLLGATILAVGAGQEVSILIVGD